MMSDEFLTYLHVRNVESDAILKILSVDFCGNVKVNSYSSSKNRVRVQIITCITYSQADLQPF